MPSKIVVVGSLNMDLVACSPRLPVPGETLTGHTFFTLPGGKGANQAFAAAKLGASVAMLGRVGNDSFGEAMRKNLAGVGCDVSGVIVSQDSASGIALIFVSDDGHNSIVIVPGANALLSALDVEEAQTQIESASYVLLQLESPMGTVIAAAKAARAAAARVILDPAPAPARALPPQLLQNVDILTPNETEATVLAGLPPGRIVASEAIEVGRKLQDLGARTEILKLGEQGCVVVGGTGNQAIPAPHVKAVDTTAAGDVFNAALAVALGEGTSLHDACAFANRAAAISVTRRGAQAAAPSRAEVDAFAAAPQE